MKYKHCWFLFVLPQIIPFLQLTVPKTITAFYSLISGGTNKLEILFFQQSNFWSDAFPFHQCSLLFLHLHLILWSRAFASVKSNSFNGETEGQNSEKETAFDSETQAVILGSGIAAKHRHYGNERTFFHVLLLGEHLSN